MCFIPTVTRKSLNKYHKKMVCHFTKNVLFSVTFVFNNTYIIIFHAAKQIRFDIFSCN